MKHKLKQGDWVICDLKIGQLKEVDGRMAKFSDSSFSLSGNTLLDRCRPLTLRNKAIVENFDYYYRELDKIDGSTGFNYPDIHRYFEGLSLSAIDTEDNKSYFADAQDFVREARDYKRQINGINLFRRRA